MPDSEPAPVPDHWIEQGSAQVVKGQRNMLGKNVGKVAWTQRDFEIPWPIAEPYLQGATGQPREVFSLRETPIIIRG